MTDFVVIFSSYIYLCKKLIGYKTFVQFSLNYLVLKIVFIAGIV